MLTKVGFQGGAVVLEDTARAIVIDALRGLHAAMEREAPRFPYKGRCGA